MERSQTGFGHLTSTRQCIEYCCLKPSRKPRWQLLSTFPSPDAGELQFRVLARDFSLTLTSQEFC